MVAEDEPKSHQRTLIFTYGTLKRGFSNHTLIQDMFSTGDAAFVGVFKTADRYPLVCGPFRVPFLLRFPGSGHRVTGELYSVSNRGLARLDELEGTSRGHYERLPIKIARADEIDGTNCGHCERSPIKIARADEVDGTNRGRNERSPSDGTNCGHYERSPSDGTNCCVEGTEHGHYERSPIKIARLDERSPIDGTNGCVEGTNYGHYERSPIKIARVDELEGHHERSRIKIARVNDLEMNGCVEEGLTCAQAYYAHDSYAMELWTKCGEKGFGCYSEKEARGYVKRGDRPRDLSFLEQINKFVSN